MKAWLPGPRPVSTNGLVPACVCVHVCAWGGGGYIRWRVCVCVCVEEVHKLDTLYQCRQAN